MRTRSRRSPLLVSFVPMLMDTGGNCGSQSSTMIIRGMAVGEIAVTDILRVVWKEVRVGVLVGVVLSLVNFIRLMLQYPGNTMICLTVVLSLFCTVVAATIRISIHRGEDIKNGSGDHGVSADHDDRGRRQPDGIF